MENNIKNIVFLIAFTGAYSLEGHAVPLTGIDTIGTPDNSMIELEYNTGDGGNPVYLRGESVLGYELLKDYSDTQKSIGVTYDKISTYASNGTLGVSANLAQGILRAYASGVDSGTYDTQNYAKASILDRVYVDQAFTAPLQVTLTMSVEGNLFTSGGSDAWVEYGIGGNPQYSLGTSDINVAHSGDPLTDAVATFQLAPGENYFDLSSELLVQGITGSSGASYIANFADTAAFQISLPEGYTFHDETGVLLSSPPTSDVPEPSSLYLLLGGLTALTMRQKLFKRKELPKV